MSIQLLSILLLLIYIYIYIYTRSLGRYAALLLAPAEDWWPLATSRWPSATWEGPSGPPNDFCIQNGHILGGQFSDILCFEAFFRFLDFKG